MLHQRQLALALLTHGGVRRCGGDKGRGARRANTKAQQHRGREPLLHGRYTTADWTQLPDPVPSTTTVVTFRWTGNLAFEVYAGAHTIVTDGDGAAGLSPVQLLGAAIGGCMGTDVALILTRGRQPLKALDVELHATRADSDPRRFVAIRIHFAVQGAVDPAQLERAINLSRDKYCSVWHCLRQDIPLETTTSISE
jgi:putative redox protein